MNYGQSVTYDPVLTETHTNTVTGWKTPNSNCNLIILRNVWQNTVQSLRLRYMSLFEPNLQVYEQADGNSGLDEGSAFYCTFQLCSVLTFFFRSSNYPFKEGSVTWILQHLARLPASSVVILNFLCTPSSPATMSIKPHSHRARRARRRARCEWGLNVDATILSAHVVICTL